MCTRADSLLGLQTTSLPAPVAAIHPLEDKNATLLALNNGSVASMEELDGKPTIDPEIADPSGKKQTKAQWEWSGFVPGTSTLLVAASVGKVSRSMTVELG